VVLIATPNGALAHGSARSIEGCDINAAIASCSQVLAGFGGHTMAAGITIERERIPVFRRLLSNSVEQQIKGGGDSVQDTANAYLQIGGYVKLGDISNEFAQQLQRLAPFGAGNPPITLACRRVALVNHEGVGRSKEHLRLTVGDEGENWRTVMWWNAAAEKLPVGTFDLAFTLQETQYKGKTELRLLYVGYRPVEDAPLPFVPPRVEIVDHRRIVGSAERERELQNSLVRYTGAVIWHDGQVLPAFARTAQPATEKANTLIMWTMPPNSEAWSTVLATVQPQTVILFGNMPTIQTSQQLVQQVAGMVKYALKHYTGEVDLKRIATQTGHLISTAELVLRYLEACGEIRIVSKERTKVVVAFEKTPPDEAAALRVMKKLNGVVEETYGYWRYFQTAAVERLLEG
jgi:single-stranded-DNA-specific exonuclease